MIGSLVVIIRSSRGMTEITFENITIFVRLFNLKELQIIYEEEQVHAT